MDYWYNVPCVYDSDEAYKILENDTFSLIILDNNLPTDSGFDVCRQLRKVSMVPIIFASARTREEDMPVRWCKRSKLDSWDYSALRINK